MALEMGEVREAMAQDCWTLVEQFAENMRSEKKPFYIVYFAKPDADIEGRGIKGIRQTIKAYYHRPAPLLGILVWYVNHPMGIFQFIPELSSPPDVPIDPSLLSTKSEDSFTGVMEKGKNLNVIVS